MFGPVTMTSRPCASPAGGPRSASFGTNGSAASRRSAASTTGCRPATTRKASERAVDHRPRPPFALGELGERRRDIEGGERRRRPLQRVGRGHHRRDEVGEDGELDRERPFGGAGDLLLELGELRRREAHGTGHGLAMDEAVRAERG